ncbi:MAG: BatA domain-containing protein, partial [Leeuwenhoekiella sp.]
MIFLHPTYFWALLGLAIPLGIHLWSKKEGRTIKVGSLKLLVASDPKKSSSIAINEWWLLLLRLLIITILVFILAEPQIKENLSKNADFAYLIEPSLLSSNKLDGILDTIPESSIRPLQSGFPQWDPEKTGENRSETPNYWQLAQQFQAIRADSIIVFSRGFQSGFRGMRPIINTKVNWIIINEENPTTAIVEANQNGNEISLLTATSNSQYLSFNKKIFPQNDNNIQFSADKDSVRLSGKNDQKWTHIDTLEPINVQLVYDENLADEKDYIQAAFRALSTYLNRG